MRFRLILLVTFSCLVWSVALGASSMTSPEKIDAFVQKAYALDLIPGAAIVVVKDGQTVYLEGVGWADREANRAVDPDTLFYIASSTKSFTALAATILSLRGDLRLDGTLARYLPSGKMHEGLAPDQITLQDLLTHQHGIDNDGPIAFRAAYSGQHTHELMVSLLPYHGPAKNGREFKYGNIGYNIASLAMDQELGKSWKDVLDAEIFTPLGMNDTTGYRSRTDANRLALPYRPEKDGNKRIHYAKNDGNMHAAGGLIMSAADLEKWLKVNLAKGELNGKQVLPARAFTLAHRPIATQDNAYGPYKRTGYGLGWNTGPFQGEKLVHHFGGFSGFHAHVSFMPERNIGVGILVNSGLGGAFADTVAPYVYALLLANPDADQSGAESIAQAKQRGAAIRERIGQDRARRAARDQTLPHPLQAYAGIYENPLIGKAEFKVVNGKLEATMGPLWSLVEVYDGTKNALRVELTGGGSVVLFEFDGDSAVAFKSDGLTFDKVGD